MKTRAVVIQAVEDKILGVERVVDCLVGARGGYTPFGKRQGRYWHPASWEEAGDIFGRIRAPSRAFPDSYWRACRTRRHVCVLVRRAMAGEQAPFAVLQACVASGIILPKTTPYGYLEVPT